MTDKVQFFHSREVTLFGFEPKGGETFCVDVPNISSMLLLLNSYLVNGEESNITINFGSCRCHPTDRYSKKEGNKLSRERMSLKTFKLLRAEIVADSIYLFVSNGEHVLYIKGYLKDHSSIPRLMQVTNVNNY